MVTIAKLDTEIIMAHSLAVLQAEKYLPPKDLVITELHALTHPLIQCSWPHILRAMSAIPQLLAHFLTFLQALVLPRARLAARLLAAESQT